MEIKKTLTQRSKFVKRRLQKEGKAKQNYTKNNTLKSFGEMQLRLNQLMHNKAME